MKWPVQLMITRPSSPAILQLSAVAVAKGSLGSAVLLAPSSSSLDQSNPSSLSSVTRLRAKLGISPKQAAKMKAQPGSMDFPLSALSWKFCTSFLMSTASWRLRLKPSVSRIW